jgi:heme-degrading monooxygenase HmoA
MVVVIFEVWPVPERTHEYFDIAAQLRADLAQIDGFISIERFESLSTPGKFLSLSCWRDEESVRRWRNVEAHRLAQAQGRAGIFADYRLRVATVIRDYGLHTRGEAPADSRDRHDSGTA